ncbi:MAG: hypothetical protein A3G41_07700 [Elusimicrobia bacterium RIFCSPLOWO2_12_FULL_59_9]|nr:MAG: hypothetical protein A3G41_07700 [Elusimicrobia bacterium RIFCSPLOWO2_12_FULL_59_9]
MIFQRAERFVEAYDALPTFIRKKVEKALLLFEQNPRHPSLHVEKIDFARNIWSARVDLNHRFTFQWISGGIHLRNVGTHQAAYRKP